MSQFRIQLRKRNVPDEELLADLKQVASQLGKRTVTVQEYTANGSFGVNTFLRRFSQWNQALKKAGLEAPNRQHIPDSELFENIANVWVKLGRQPLGRELDKVHGLSEFSLGTYEGRFGSWNKALIAFDTFMSDGKTAKAPPRGGSKVPAKRRTGAKVNWRLRAQVLIRDNCICQMCGASPAKDPSVELHADHINPYSKGGDTVLENLRTLCLRCNVGKSNVVFESNSEVSGGGT